jgi:hypothetical protein
VQYTQEELKKRLKLHAEWLADNKKGKRADLSGADLSGADLSRADLSRANLSGADLSRADLSGANLSGADLPNFKIVPDTGPFGAYKKLSGGAIAVLFVPRSAKRTSSLVGRKCRVSKAKVKKIFHPDAPGKAFTKGKSKHNPSFGYEVGKWVKVDDFDDDIRVECTKGIHCFITLKEALEYE